MDIYLVLWNLILLGIVGISLYLFRKSDKNSKSLEQVKKYSQKRYEEFDQYVEEKKSELNDLSIALEVQEKTGAVILGKIRDEVDELSDQISHVEKLKTKVTSYESTMTKMLGLSTELDERYTLLRKDANYLDQVDKKVKDGKKKLQTIEKNIDDITLEFIKNNNNSINKLKSEVLETTKVDISNLSSRLNESSLDLDKLSSKINELNSDYENSSIDSLNSFKSSLNKLLDSHRDNIIKITKEGESLEEASFSEIRDKIEHRSNNLMAILDDKLKAISVENSDKISKLSMDMGNIEVVANTIKEENQTRLNSIKDQLDKQLLMLKELNSEGISSLHSEFSLNFNEFKEVSLGEINICRDESLELINSLKDQISEAKDYKSEVINSYAETEKYINNELGDLKYRFDSSINEVTKELDSHEESIKAAAIKQIDESIDLFKDEVESKLIDLSSINDRVDNIKIELEENINRGRLDIDSELISFKDQFKNEQQDLLNEVIKLKNDFKEVFDNNNTLIENEKEKFNLSMNIIKESQKELSNEIYNNEEEIRDQIQSQRERLVSSVNDELDRRIDVLKEDLFNKLESFKRYEDKIVESSTKLEELIDSNSKTLEGQVHSLNQHLTSEIESERDKFNNFKDNFYTEKNSLDNDIKKLKEDSYNNVSEKLNIFEDSYFHKLKEKEAFIESETTRLYNHLNETIKGLEDETSNKIIQNMENINTQVNDFKLENLEKLDLLTNSIKIVEDDLANKSKDFEEKINNDILELNNNIESITNLVKSDTEGLQIQLQAIAAEQKEYVNETEIFIKTDQLRNELNIAIGELNTKLNDVETKTELVASTEEKLNNLKNAIKNINKQIENTENKKNKIETLENRVAKVLELSDSIDEKLIKIRDSEEKIGDIQLKLRELKDLEVSVQSEFERLENKENILTETNRAIDSGFGHIQIIENKLDLLKESLNPFNNQIENIQGKLSRVEERKGKIDKAITTLSNLDKSLETLDDRINKMDKAREWIAGVETRLEESVRSAEEQVKLMGALAQNKNDKNSNVNTSSAPNINMRDMVIKLSHQGWKPDAISKTTKLSRGEVELILELYPRK